MILAKLFVLGQERVLLWTDMTYQRGIRKTGKPNTEILGGLITLCYKAQENDDIILRWMTKPSKDKTWEEVDKMEKGKICFYENGFDYPPTKTYIFNNGLLVYYQEIFHTNGAEPMKTIITISPAIQNYGTDFIKRWNVSWITPEERPYKGVENKEEFYVSIKHLTEKDTVVPLGIPSFRNASENKNIEFVFEVTQNDIDEFQIEFLHDNKVIQTYYSSKQTLDEVFVTAENSGNSSSAANTPQSPTRNYKTGKYKIKWDGFDSNGIYDSTIFTTGKLKVRLKAKRDGKEKTTESSEFTFEQKVKWVDAKINRNTKRIDITLRVNLTDGGEKGTEKECRELGKGKNAPIVRVCPWDKIPEEGLIPDKPILKARTRSFEALEKLALAGLKYHWGRNREHHIAKNVAIDGELFEIFINAVNTTENAMDDIELIFNTNNPWMRSGNPGTVEGPVSLIGNMVSREAICYNVGYIKEHSEEWEYYEQEKEDIEFKYTTAHEIGHTILKAYGGTFYSYGHKGTVITVTQKMKSDAPEYPADGEIDIMPYYPYNPPIYFYNRYVASEKDVLSLLWLTKLKLK